MNHFVSWDVKLIQNIRNKKLVLELLVCVAFYVSAYDLQAGA